jgi:hypothetical protein
LGIIRNLKNINETIEKQNAPFEGTGRARFFKLADGETKKIRFLQELDSSSPTYNPKAGFLAVEHELPTDFKKRALCSYDDEGRCWACEQHQADFKKWRPKVKLYVNVAVEEKDDDDNTVWNVYVLSQGNGAKSVTPWLLDYAGDNGSITNKVFRIKRKGAGQKDTSYTLTPGPDDVTPYDVTQYELYDLDKVVNDVPYDEQEKFFNGEQVPANDEDAQW